MSSGNSVEGMSRITPANFAPGYEVEIQAGPNAAGEFATTFLVSEEGALPFTLARFFHQRVWKNGSAPEVQWVGTESLGRSTLGAMWNGVILESQESEVIQALPNHRARV